MRQPFPADDYKAAMNIQDSMTDKHETQITKRVQKRNTAFPPWNGQ